MVTKHCRKNTNVKIIFKSTKIGSYFTSKDTLPNDLRSHVVYKFICSFCNIGYIGETTRHYGTSVLEHLKTDKTSSIFKHLHDAENHMCLSTCDENCFTILDKAPTRRQLKIKEAFYINKYMPVLNGQDGSIPVALAI